MGIKKDQVISEMAKELKVKCETCDKMFMYKSELKVHVKAVHLKIKGIGVLRDTARATKRKTQKSAK